MSDSPHSPLWYRTAHLKPALRDHVDIRPHKYRERLWYVVHDRVQGRLHRLNRTAYYLVGLMNGQRTVDEIWRTGLANLGDHAPTQSEMIQLLGKLYMQDVLQTDSEPDLDEIFRRANRTQKERLKKSLWNPLYIRLPLWDPDRFLTRFQRWVSPIFSAWGLAVWCLVVGFGAILGLRDWDALTQDFVDRVLSSENLFILWLTYPVVKALHELGHAFATKVWGGEVHEMGLTLLALIPIPYVDASAASGFARKQERAFVAGAGIMTEMFLAALALFVWLNAEPGIVRAVAYNVFLIGGLSTLLFNGNPLLRFDGYYVLSDLLEMPSLSPRSNRYLIHLIERHLLRLKQPPPPESLGERAWLLIYGISSVVYRIVVLSVLLVAIASKFFFIGVVLALWALGTWLLVPLFKGLRYLFHDPKLHRHRLRAIGITMATLAALLLGLFGVPISNTTIAEGIVWPAKQSQIRAGTSCTVDKILHAENLKVRASDPLIACKDPFITTEERIIVARLDELEARYLGKPMAEQAEKKILREQIRAVSSDLSRIRERIDALVIRSPADGTFVVPDVASLPGRFVHQGDLIGYVLNPDASTTKVVVSQDNIGLLQQEIREVQVMLSGRLGESYSATLQRQTPGAAGRLPTPALGSAGGGSIPVNPVDEQGTQTLQSVFVLDLAMAPEATTATVGHRVFVRFDHGPEPLAFQLYRRLRQVFLKRLSV